MPDLNPCADGICIHAPHPCPHDVLPMQVNSYAVYMDGTSDVILQIGNGPTSCLRGRVRPEVKAMLDRLEVLERDREAAVELAAKRLALIMDIHEARGLNADLWQRIDEAVGA